MTPHHVLGGTANLRDVHITAHELPDGIVVTVVLQTTEGPVLWGGSTVVPRAEVDGNPDTILHAVSELRQRSMTELAMRGTDV